MIVHGNNGNGPAGSVPVPPTLKQWRDRAAVPVGAASELARRVDELKGSLAAELASGASALEVAELELQLSDALRRLGDVSSARGIWRRAGDRIAPASLRPIDGRVALMASRLAWDEGLYLEALAHADEAYHVFLELKDELGIANSFLEAGKAHSRLRNPKQARDHYEDARAIYKRLGDSPRLAVAHNNLGIIYKNAGNWAQAIEHLSEALNLDTQAGNLGELPYRYLNLGIVHLKMGSWDTARDNLHAAQLGAEKTGNKWLWINSTIALANYHRLTQEIADAASLYDTALEAAHALGFPRELALAHEFRGDLHRETGHLDLAVADYRRALAIAEEIAPEGDVASEVTRRLADACLELGQLDDALAFVDRAISIARPMGDRYEEGAALRVRGLVLAALERLPEAFTCLAESRELLASINERFELGKTLYETSRLMRDVPDGDADEAWRLLKEASYHFEQLKVRDWIARVDRELMAYRRSLHAAPKRQASSPDRSRLAAERFREKGIVTHSPLMVDVLEMAEKAAKSRFCILIQGETGTGKERLARAIHMMGGKKLDSFVAVNCNSLPEGLQESELFGHAAGAYTDAKREKPGLFEIADGGTLFLDEVTDLSPAAQGKLLRILEDGELRRVGETKSRKVNVRILAACNKSALEEAKNGRFRKDLFYRLSVFPVTLPALRERPEDVAPLVEYFLQRESAQENKTVTLGPDALQALEDYEWPGNVRELENMICRMFVLADADSTIHRDDLPAEILVKAPGRGGEALSLKERVELFEREQIERALRASGGDKDRTAANLNITRRWLTEKMRRYHLDRSGTIVPEFEGEFPEDLPRSTLYA